MITRRGLITGLATFLAAPAIVRAGSIMPVKAWADVQDHGSVVVQSFMSTDPDAWVMLPAGEHIYTGDLIAIRDGKVFRVGYSNETAVPTHPCHGVAMMGSAKTALDGRNRRRA